MRTTFRKINTSPAGASSLTSKILNIIEQANIQAPFLPDGDFSLSSGLEKKASIDKHSGIIPLTQALESGNFKSEGLGVYTCSADKSIWRIDKDAATGEDILVRNEQYDEAESLVQEIMSTVSQ